MQIWKSLHSTYYSHGWFIQFKCIIIIAHLGCLFLSDGFQVCSDAVTDSSTHRGWGGGATHHRCFDVSNLRAVQCCSVTGFCKPQENPLASFTSKCALYREVYQDKLSRDFRQDRGASLLSISRFAVHPGWVSYRPNALVFCSQRGRCFAAHA